MTNTVIPSTGEDPEDELRLALQDAALDPTPASLAAVLRHMPEKEIRSEWSRRLNARRTTRRGGHWINHYPEHANCQCEGCRIRRGGPKAPTRHKHKALSRRPADVQSPGCKDKDCPKPHVIVRCACGATGVECPRYPYAVWYKETNEERKDNAQ